MQDTKLQEVIEISTHDSNLSAEMIESLMEQVSDWNIIKGTNGYQLQRVFDFEDFYDASQFVYEIGKRTQTSDHYPHVIIDRKRVMVTWWTPQMQGLIEQDFIMAIATDEAYDAWSTVTSKQNRVDEASAESFPASDPPAHTPDDSQ